jgi:hypothetical protein
MATHGPIQLPAHFATDQDFRDWITGIRAALEAVGLVRTADTNQVDTATVTKPVAANATAGADIFRFNDAAQANCPVFIRLVYGSGAVATTPSLSIQVGTGSSGSGGLTGTVSTQFQVPGTARSAGQTLPVYASGDGAGVVLAAHWDATPSGMLIIVDRPRLANGNPTTEGFWWGAAAGVTGRQQVIPDSGTAAAAGTQLTGPILHGLWGETKAGSDVAVIPRLITVNGRIRYLKYVFGYLHADLPADTTFTASWLGATRTLRPFGRGIDGAAISQYDQPPIAFATIWE